VRGFELGSGCEHCLFKNKARHDHPCMSCTHAGRVPIVYPAVNWYRRDPSPGPLWAGRKRRVQIVYGTKPDQENDG